MDARKCPNDAYLDSLGRRKWYDQDADCWNSLISFFFFLDFNFHFIEYITKNELMHKSKLTSVEILSALNNFLIAIFNFRSNSIEDANGC